MKFKFGQKLETPSKGEESFEVEQKNKEGKIENENWQNQLNVAFQRDDFSLIKILQRVRPDNFPDPELVRGKLNEIVESRHGGWEQTYRAIREISSIEPDAMVIEAEFSKLFEKYGREKGILDNLKNLTRTTGFTPSPEQVQAKYVSIIKGEKSYDFGEEELFKNVIELTGIKPDASLIHEVIERGDIRRAQELSPLFGVEITSEMIQHAYEILFEKNGSLDTYLISELDEKPNPTLVEKAYQKIIEKHEKDWMYSIKSLEQSTDVKPTFTEESLRPVFEEYFSNGLYGQKGYIGVEHVTKMTGIKAPVDLVEKTALKIVDASKDYINQGNKIKVDIERLRESIGGVFEIPEQEIQNRYHQAMMDRKAHVISYLYGAFGIRHLVDKETARQFMVGMMNETYHIIPELENVFGVKFKATKEEIEAKQDENLEKLNFDGLAKIKDLTGEDCDTKKLEVTLIQWLEKEVTVSSEKSRDYSPDWEKRVKQRLEQFNIIIPPEVAINIYTSLIQNETAHSSNLTKVCQLTGVPIPDDLAQQAYRKYLSPDYTYRITTEQGSFRSLGSVSGAFEELFKISGIKPEIPNDVLQTYYRGFLEEELQYGLKIHGFQKILEITGVQPEFDPNDINQLYKQLVLKGREDNIRCVKEITGIELQLDKETQAYVSSQIEAGIEKVRSADYEKNDTYNLKYDLEKVGILIVSTGVKADTERLQSTYPEILAGDPYWATKIEQIVKVTGIKPVFSSEQLQAKGQEFLEKGALRSFERLEEYGQFTFTPEVAGKMYDALLATNRSYNEYDIKHYYNKDWVDRIKRFKEKARIAPTETQLAEIFSDISEDDQREKSRYGDRVEETIKFFVDNFQTEITGGMVKDIAVSYLARGDVNSMKKFIEKMGATLELTDGDLLPHVSRLLEAKELNSLAYLKQEMKLAHLPVIETVAQSAYQHLVSQEDFGKENSKSLQAFKQIFELTGVPANFPVEQADRVYKTSRFVEWQKLNEVIDELPSNDVVQYKYLQFFTDLHYGLDKNIEAIRTLTGQSPEAETISKALEHFASEGKIEEMSNIVKIVGGKPDINHESGQKAYRKITEQFNSSSSVYWGEKLVATIDLLNDTLGIRPDSETMYQIYSKTIGEADYKNAYEDADGERVYPQFWEFLVKKFGKPDSEVVQRMYLAQLTA